MKILITIVLSLFVTAVLLSQNDASNESIAAEIRRLENKQVDAILKGDIAALDELFHQEYVVNAPINQVTSKTEVLKRVREGLIRYSAFDIEIESLVIQGDLVITMGRETVKPIGNAPLAGQTVLRRYTHVWLRKNGHWKQIARHANFVCPELRLKAD